MSSFNNMPLLQQTGYDPNFWTSGQHMANNPDFGLGVANEVTNENQSGFGGSTVGNEDDLLSRGANGDPMLAHIMDTSELGTDSPYNQNMEQNEQGYGDKGFFSNMMVRIETEEINEDE